MPRVEVAKLCAAGPASSWATGPQPGSRLHQRRAARAARRISQRTSNMDERTARSCSCSARACRLPACARVRAYEAQHTRVRSCRGRLLRAHNDGDRDPACTMAQWPHGACAHAAPAAVTPEQRPAPAAVACGCGGSPAADTRTTPRPARRLARSRRLRLRRVARSRPLRPRPPAPRCAHSRVPSSITVLLIHIDGRRTVFMQVQFGSLFRSVGSKSGSCPRR